MMSWVVLAAVLPFALAAPTIPMAPVHRTINGRSVDGSYIVAFKSGAVNATNRANWLEKTLAEGGATVQSNETLRLGWSVDVFDGIAGTFDNAGLKALQASGDVDYIVEDTIMSATAIISQNNSPWGLSRLSSTGRLTNRDVTSLDHTYTFDDSAGAGVDIYIVDTGIRTTHTVFEGRATFGASFGNGTPGQDVQGHGTHVAGTAAGRRVGVANKASLIAVKVLDDDGQGATSDIISGINFATQSAQQSGRPSVINMSLGGPANNAIDQAARNAVRAGVHVVVAAGNESQDANNVSPSRVAEVITVGAMTIDDRIASFSNFGNKVDIFAPGQDIISASNANDNGGQSLSGTSMASPHIAGFAAYLLALEGDRTPADLAARMAELSTQGAIRGLPGNTVNDLAFNGAA